MLGSGAGRSFSEEVRMGRRRHTPEQIITALREAEVGLANGKTIGAVSRELGISEQTYLWVARTSSAPESLTFRGYCQLEAGLARLLG